MAGKVLFAQVLHSHQPVGNFDHIFDWACREAYQPYIEEYLRTGRMPVSLHLSGPLLEWMDQHKHPTLDALRRCAKECDVEFVGGGWYEPILTMLPRRDAEAQLKGGADLVERLFGKRPEGAWVTERVWEQNLAGLLVDCGYKYVCLDDSHFAHAGIGPEGLGPYYWAESDGKLLAVFPASEQLRYLIPFGTIEDVIAELRSYLPEDGLALVVYADDGEKFGLWPGTAKHVFEDGWLARYHAALAAEGDWLEPVTLSEGFNRLESAGVAYFGDDSYREMTEWVLPAEPLAELLQAEKELKDDGRYHRLKRFVRGGTWRAFKAKYSELRRMYARMLGISNRIAKLPKSKAREAARELYRSQCNCAWWHGVFGGVYMPHLRGAVWRHMLRAERLAEKAEGHKSPGIDEADFDLDGNNELRLSTSKLSAFISPRRGGHIFELDWVPGDENLTDVLTRRYEAYHQDIRDRLASGGNTGSADSSVSIHDLDRETTNEHGSHLVYDREPLESLVDHVIVGDWSVDDLWRDGIPGAEEFRIGDYELTDKSCLGKSSSLALSCSASLPCGKDLSVAKKIGLSGSKLKADYSISNIGPETASFTFGVELNLGPDFALPTSEPRGPEVVFCEHSDSLKLTCNPKGLAAALKAPEGAAAAWQVKTVSQSETSYEITVQGLALFVWWYLELEPGQGVEKSLTLSVQPE